MNKLFSSTKKTIYCLLLLNAIVLIAFLTYLYFKIASHETSFLNQNIDKKTLATLFFELKNTFLLLLFFILFSTTFTLYYFDKNILKPIGYIISALNKRSVKCIKALRTFNGEFGSIGNLLQDENNNNYLLVQAKLKAEENDKLKTTFLENLTHEIRTPMNAIVGFSDLIMTTEISDNLRQEYTSIIHKSGKNLVCIIDDLIEVSRINSNQIIPNYSLVNIDNCLQELFETIKVSIPKEKKIDFSILKNISQKLQSEVKVDEVKLRQIITNLINNAIKYTNEGYVTFGYNIIEKEDFEFIKIVVKDTGVGISAENHNTIFERFQRVENDKAIEVGGLGLGLAISKAYTEVMGGTITVEPNFPNGSIFTVYIPIKLDKTVIEIIHKELDVKEQKLVKKTKCILIAEDDNINFMLIKKMLEPTNCLIIRAENGEIAVKKCQENDAIDLILMDIKMPVMNGYEAYEIIKKLKPNIPVIAQTAYSTVEDRERIDSLNFASYISKPINKEKLIEEVVKFI